MRYLLVNRHFRIIEIVKLFEFEDPKGVIRIRKSKKDGQYNDQRKNGQTTIYKALHRKLKIKQHELHLKWTK